MKLLPFNIAAIKNGAKCVDEYRNEWRYSFFDPTNGATLPFKFIRLSDDYVDWFTIKGLGNASDSQLSILDESETEQESTKESFWRLLNVGEEILATDEGYLIDESEERAWFALKGKNSCGNVYTKHHVPMRRLVTIPSPVSPWVRYVDRKPTKEEPSCAEADELVKIAFLEWSNSPSANSAIANLRNKLCTVIGEREDLKRELARIKEQPNTIALPMEKFRRYLWVLRQIMSDIPTNRDWLNPDVEKEAFEILTTALSQQPTKPA